MSLFLHSLISRNIVTFFYSGTTWDHSEEIKQFTLSFRNQMTQCPTFPSSSWVKFIFFGWGGHQNILRLVMTRLFACKSCRQHNHEINLALELGVGIHFGSGEAPPLSRANHCLLNVLLCIAVNWSQKFSSHVKRLFIFSCVFIESCQFNCWF